MYASANRKGRVGDAGLSLRLTFRFFLKVVVYAHYLVTSPTHLTYWWWWLIPCRWGFWKGWWSVFACSLVAVVSDAWRADPLAFWTGESRGLRMTRMLLALCPSCVFPLRLHTSLPQTYDWLFSLMSASCLGLRPPAAMTDGWLPSLLAVSSAGLCNAFLEHYDHAFLLWASWRSPLWVYIWHPSSWSGQPSPFH